MKLKLGLACRRRVVLLLLLCDSAAGMLVSVLSARGQYCTAQPSPLFAVWLVASHFTVRGRMLSQYGPSHSDSQSF